MAIKDPAVGQSGGLSTLVSVDTTRYFDTQPIGFALDTNVVATRIGGATQLVEDPAYPGKAIQLRLTAGVVANGGVVATGWLNRTGASVPTGKYLFTVAA